ncbi:MAG TPA: hypothetical protein VEW69_13170, partial [Alphaproteobacteria bacterium]|nr:hypothetical protein [Alphaproteobacteria bacterium]
MKRTIICFVALIASGLPALASSLGTATRSVIPSEIQQIINVDYRRMKSSETAMAMKAKLIPPNMKQFEDALREIGVVPEQDLEQITLAAFRTKDHGIQTIGVAQGTFPRKTIRQRLVKQSIKGSKVADAVVYAMAGGMQMTFLDDWTMLFGPELAMEAALDARDNSAHSLNANGDVTDMIASVDQGTIWSVLDKEGTQNMLRSVLGPASSLAEYDSVKKSVKSSRYTMDFDHGVDFNLNVITSDGMTAATLSSLLKAGILLKKMDASAPEKKALEGTSVDSDSGKLIVHFRTDD